MNNTRQKLIKKIKDDTGFIVNPEWPLYRPTLTWVHKSAGRMIWYWYDHGICIGSSEKMRVLLKSNQIKMHRPSFGFIDFSSS